MLKQVIESIEKPKVPDEKLKARLQELLDWAYKRLAKGRSREDMDTMDKLIAQLKREIENA